MKLKLHWHLHPVFDAQMAVGEGAGAVMMASALRMADTVFHDALKFGDSGVDQYENYNSNI